LLPILRAFKIFSFPLSFTALLSSPDAIVFNFLVVSYFAPFFGSNNAQLLTLCPSSPFSLSLSAANRMEKQIEELQQRIAKLEQLLNVQVCMSSPRSTGASDSFSL
jgi:hypothetical protein